MKKALLTILIVLMLICIIALSFRIYTVLTAENAEDTAEEAVPTATPAAVAPTPESTPEVTAAPSASTAEDAEVLKGLMTDFKDRIQPGTAGSSLKAAEQAVRLINWGISTQMTDEEISKTVGEYLAGMDSEQKENYLLQMDLLDSTYQQLLTPGQDGFLESAGCADSGYPWGTEPIPAVEAFFEATGERAFAAQ